MKFKSIATRISILLIPTIFITLLSFAVLSYSISNSQINKSINENIYKSLQAADLQIQLELYKNASVAISFANYAKTLHFNTFNHDDNRIFLTEVIKSNENTFGGGIWFEPYAFDPSSYYFGPFLYMDDSGEAFYTPEYSEYADYFNEDWYIKGKSSNGDLIWSKVYYDPFSTITMVTVSKPFFDESGRFIGMGTADMNIKDVQKIVSEISIGETGKAFILGVNGEYISYFDNNKSANESMQNDSDEELARLGKEINQNTSGTSMFLKDGKKHRVYYTQMESVGWTLGVTMEENEIYSSTISTFIVMTVIPFLGLLLVILGIIMIIKYLRRIINKVNNFADMAASGDFSRRIDVTETDEFGVMEQQLNKMISNMSDMSSHSAQLLSIAENASKSKSEFLSRMSHEIRTPMNAIIGMTQIAKNCNEPKSINDCLIKIERASKHLLALINDILDMSKIEANKLELSEEEFDLRQSLMSICSMLLIKAEEKNQELVLSINENVPSFIISDELRLSQVITNLVGNAVKFTPDNGKITVNVNIAGVSGAGVSETNEPMSNLHKSNVNKSETETDLNDKYITINISVTDTGIGLSKEQQAKLFNSFEQVDGSISRKFGGTGLGLAISKRIVELMGGKIMVESEPDKGSVFSFTIKALRGTGDITAKNQAVQHGNNNINSLKILVADDSEEAISYMKYILNSLRLDCDSVCDGEEALTAAKKAIAENHPYDIVFMDYLMPKLNGIEAASKIKRLTNDSTSIIMVSVYDWKDIKQVAKEAGINKHIAKPFTPSCVLNSINEAAAGKIKNLSKMQTTTSDFSANTILLVDDVEINREIVTAFLENTKINIDCAENGLDAIKMFSANPEKYDLILMDIQMPEMDGFEATRKIREMDITRAKTIPIIAMTANALSEDVEKCKEAGMNDHMAKPIEPETLLFKLNDYFFLKDYLNSRIY